MNIKKSDFTIAIAKPGDERAWFSFVKNSSSEVRHKVYVKELKLEPENMYRMELDAYDGERTAYAVVLWKGAAVGTVRFVMDNLPLENENEYGPVPLFSRIRVGEVSRFCSPRSLSSDIKKEVTTRLVGASLAMTKMHDDDGSKLSRDMHMAVFCDYRLIKMLQKMGVPFYHLGEKMHNGVRRICGYVPIDYVIKTAIEPIQAVLRPLGISRECLSEECDSVFVSV